MKIIFLDIDGVLNTTADWVERSTFGPKVPDCVHLLNTTKLALLANIVNKTGAKIVISSSWRSLGEDNIHERFVAKGWNLPRTTIIGRTTSKLNTSFRGFEVKHWLDHHPEVEQYVIFDDDADFLPEQFPYFIHTSGWVGLHFMNAEYAIALLNNDIKEIEDTKRSLTLSVFKDRFNIDNLIKPTNIPPEYQDPPI